MVNVNSLLAVSAGVFLATGLYHSKLTQAQWLSLGFNFDKYLLFASIFSFGFWIQFLTGLNYLAIPYLGYLHIVGGIIFGTGLFLTKSCPLSLFNFANTYSKRWLNLIKIMTSLYLGIIIGRFLTPHFPSANEYNGYSIYLFDIFQIDPQKIKLALALFFSILQFFFITKSKNKFQTILVSILIALAFYIAQILHIEIGTISGLKQIISIEYFDNSGSMSMEKLFSSSLFLTLFIFAWRHQKGSSRSERIPFAILIGFFLLALGGEIAGGCTLTHGMDGILALSLGSLLFVLSSVFIFTILLLTNRWRASNGQI